MENLRSGLNERSQEMFGSLEDKAHSFAQSLGSLVDSVENVIQVAKRLMGLFRDQKRTLVDISQGAVSNVAPIVSLGRDALGKGKDAGSRLVSKGREHPIAVIAGAACVIGGIALLAYYLRQQETERAAESIGA